MNAHPSCRLARPRVFPCEPRRLRSVVASVLVLAMTAGLLVAVEPQSSTTASQGQTERPCENPHPLDRQLEQATDGLGPSTATAAVYAEYAAKWDAELNRVYRLLLAELSPNEQTQLREAQRAWLKSRDADGRVIDALYSPDGRSVPTMIVSAHAYARMNLTRERALCLIRWRERHAEIVAERSETPEPSVR